MILIIGSSGYIGTEFVKQLQKDNTTFISISYKDINRKNLISLINTVKIKYIINCAAFVGKPNIEACESQKDKTIDGNILFPLMLKEICEEFGIILCHVSTGCLYNGPSPSSEGWNENNEPNFSFELNNCSFYTGTKVMAEKYIKPYERSYIWRIRLPFENEHNNRNYISKVINYNTLVTEPNSISNKQEFVKACLDSIKLEIPFGIYNITNTGAISSIDIVNKLVKTIKPDKTAKFITTEEFYKMSSPMPRSNCIIDNSKILSMGIKLSEVDECVDKCLKNWKW
jgi:UDP-glucose 4,6-dehydratase